MTERCDVVVLPYDSHIPNCRGGTKIFQAMSAGKPLLAQKGTASGDLVKTYAPGYLTDLSSVSALRETVMRMSRSSTVDLDSMGRSGRNLMEHQSYPKAIAASYVELLNTLGTGTSLKH